jgi:hypothetical protein
MQIRNKEILRLLFKMPHMWINLYNEFTDILNEKYKSDPARNNSQKKKAIKIYLIQRTLMADFNGRSRFKRPLPEHAKWQSCG